MSLVVQKYGGTSVGSVDRIKNVARRALAAQAAGHQVVLVVSAMSGETNRLLALTKQLSQRPDEREQDVVIATGEQVTVGLVALAIQDLGGKARSYLGHQVRITTDSAFSKARIRSIDGDALFASLSRGEIAVVAGFQGQDDAGNVTTLGRGGSDTTAVAVAAALQMSVGHPVTCEIYTDVDGVFTTDPNICKGARKLDRISYEEMLELASLGAKVLQIRSVEFAMKYKVPLWVKSSFNDDPGTLVCEEDAAMEDVVVAGVAHDMNEARVAIRSVPDKPGIARQIFGALAEGNVVVDMIVQNVSADGRTDLTFTVTKTDLARARETIEKLLGGDLAGARVETGGGIAKVSIVGVGMRNHAGVAAKMFDVLATENINILMISTSEIRVSCVIDEKYTELAVRALHTAFGLDKPAAGAGG